MSEKESKLNPQITGIEIGVRELRTVTLYPLSIPDQFKMGDMITEALQQVAGGRFERLDDAAVVDGFVDLIKKNIGVFLSLATCGEEDGDALLAEITNTQLSEIAKVIFEVNFEPAIKNFKGLFEKANALFQSKRPSPRFASDTAATVSRTSTGNPSRTAE